MNNDQRMKASVDLTLTYLQSYFSQWRLTKVIANNTMLVNKYDFFKDIATSTKKHDDTNGEATIAQEITNGLYFDSIAQCVQYVEDLFALINASKTPEYFVRNIVTYSAGLITNQIKTFDSKRESICSLFWIPDSLPFGESEVEKMNKTKFENGVGTLSSLVNDIVKFYKEYWFFYNQYKHGLAIAMRTFGNKLSDEAIDLDKQGDTEPYLAVYDNLNLKAAGKRGTFTQSHGVFMPGFTENVRPHISKLEKENNFLRLVFPPNLRDEFSREYLEDVAYKVSCCIELFIGNYSSYIKPEDKTRVFHLPVNHKQREYFRVSYWTE